jgi:DNA repair exonuclease SbcCD nuclease subunit
MKLLLTSDWHIRADQPKCRKDDFMKTQMETLDFIYNLAETEEARIIIAGDIFDKPQPAKSQELEILLQKYFAKVNTMWIAGNHDTLYHNHNNHNKTSLGVLEPLNCIYGFNENFRSSYYIKYNNFNQTIKDECLNKPLSQYNIMLEHIYCEEKALPAYIENGIMANQILNDNLDYDLIVTGDNHRGFFVRKGNRLVVNPGCITRQKGDMKDYKPHIYLLDTEKNTIGKIFLPDNNIDNVTNNHNEEKKKKQEELHALIESFKISNNKSKDLKEQVKETGILNNTDQGIIDYMLLCVECKNEKIIEKLLEYWECV